MHLIIDNYGVKLEVEDDKFKISTEKEIRYASPLKITSINILKPCSVTTPALALAAKNQVPVLIYSNLGKVQACIWSHQYGTIADIRLRQAFFAQNAEAIEWATYLIKLKIEGQRRNLQWLTQRVIAKKEETGKKIGGINGLLSLLQHAGTKEDIRVLEAQASRQYWDAIVLALEKYITIPGREKRGAADPFNICLNYLYGILYGQTEASLIMAGLDPYMGILHINRHAKPSLAYDHIEPFRPWADRLVMELFMQGFYKTGNFQPVSTNEVTITISGKRELINRFFSFMEQRSYLNNKRIKNKDHLHHLSSSLVTVLKKFKLP